MDWELCSQKLDDILTNICNMTRDNITIVGMEKESDDDSEQDFDQDPLSEEELPTSTVPSGNSFLTPSHTVKTQFDYNITPAKQISRLGVGNNVQACVKRFLYGTMPKKLWFDDFETQYTTYNEIWYMRKYDGWFVTLFVNKTKHIEWQTMGGYIFKFMDSLMYPFVQFLQEKATQGVLPVDYALKMEFTARSKSDGREVLHEIGDPIADKLQYVLVITDFFEGYSKTMDEKFYQILHEKQLRNRKHKHGPIDTSEWRNLWAENSLPLETRLAHVKQLLNNGEETTENYFEQFNHGKIDVEVAEVYRYVTEDEHPVKKLKNPIPYLASCISTEKIEGFVLHCYNHHATGGRYDIFKLKLEQLGGLGYFYKWPKFAGALLDPNFTKEQKFAGRQFVARLLTVECFPGSFIPYSIGIGYWDPRATAFDTKTKGAYCVSNSLKLKGVFSKFGSKQTARTADKRYLSVGNLSTMGEKQKHTELTESNRSVANMIAMLIEHATCDLYDNSNLFFTQCYLKDGTKAVLNVSQLGIVVGGSANMVYLSQKGNFHLQAATVKCIGINSKRACRQLNHENCLEWLSSTGTLPVCMKSNIMEWTKLDWDNFVNLELFNKNKILSEMTDYDRFDIITATAPEPYVAPVGDKESTAPEIVSYLNVYMFCCYSNNNKHNNYTFVLSKKMLKTMIEEYKINIVNLDHRDDKCANWKFTDLEYPAKGAMKKLKIVSYPSVPPDATIKDKIDLILIWRPTFDKVAREMDMTQPSQLYEKLVANMSYRCTVCNLSWIKDKVKSVIYQSPGSRSLDYERENRFDKQNRNWKMPDNDDIDQFLQQRQQERMEYMIENNEMDDNVVPAKETVQSVHSSSDDVQMLDKYTVTLETMFEDWEFGFNVFPATNQQLVHVTKRITTRAKTLGARTLDNFDLHFENDKNQWNVVLEPSTMVHDNSRWLHFLYIDYVYLLAKVRAYNAAFRALKLENYTPFDIEDDTYIDIGDYIITCHEVLDEDGVVTKKYSMLGTYFSNEETESFETFKKAVATYLSQIPLIENLIKWLNEHKTQIDNIDSNSRMSTQPSQQGASQAVQAPRKDTMIVSPRDDHQLPVRANVTPRRKRLSDGPESDAPSKRSGESQSSMLQVFDGLTFYVEEETLTPVMQDPILTTFRQVRVNCETCIRRFGGQLSATKLSDDNPSHINVALRYIMVKQHNWNKFTSFKFLDYVNKLITKCKSLRLNLPQFIKEIMHPMFVYMKQSEGIFVCRQGGMRFIERQQDFVTVPDLSNFIGKDCMRSIMEPHDTFAGASPSQSSKATKTAAVQQAQSAAARQPPHVRDSESAQAGDGGNSHRGDRSESDSDSYQSPPPTRSPSEIIREMRGSNIERILAFVRAQNIVLDICWKTLGDPFYSDDEPKQNAMKTVQTLIGRFEADCKNMDDYESDKSQFFETHRCVVFYEYPINPFFRYINIKGSFMLHHLFFVHLGQIIDGTRRIPSEVSAAVFFNVYTFKLSKQWTTLSKNGGIIKKNLDVWYWQNQFNNNHVFGTDLDCENFFNNPQPLSKNSLNPSAPSVRNNGFTPDNCKLQEYDFQDKANKFPRTPGRRKP